MRALGARWAFKNDYERLIDRLINYFGEPDRGSGRPRPVMGPRGLCPQPVRHPPRRLYHTSVTGR
jgi:hypothetical protein